MGAVANAALATAAAKSVLSSFDIRAVITFVLFLIVAIKWLIDTPPARRRKILRLRAVAGEVDAMPLAASQPNPEAARSVDLEPLDFIGRPAKSARISLGVIAAILVPCLGALGVWGIGLALTQENIYRSSSDILTGAILVAVLAATALLGLAGAALIVASSMPDVMGARRGISATAGGLHEITPQGAFFRGINFASSSLL